MSGIEINKIAGAILTAALLAMVVGILGDALVKPREHAPADIQVAERAPAAAPEKKELPPIAPLLAKADVAAGQREANKCKACHVLDEDKNRVGPYLHGVFGRPAGTAEGFTYSPAMKDSGIVWDEETIAEYVADPKAFVPGNRMAFPGLKKEEDITNLLAYLKEATQ